MWFFTLQRMQASVWRVDWQANYAIHPLKQELSRFSL
jgi:hypothetical protein